MPTTPDNERSTRRRNIILLAGAGAAAVTGAAAVDKIATGHFPWEASNTGIVTPGNTPEPSASIRIPSATPGESVIVTLPPTENSTIQPSEQTLPEWAKKIPAQPLSPDSVPLSDGTKTALKNKLAGVQIVPVNSALGHIIIAQGETLISATPTSDGKGILACGTTGGENYSLQQETQTANGKPEKVDAITGPVCFLFDENVSVITQEGQTQGLDALAPLLKQGSAFTAIMQGMVTDPKEISSVNDSINQLEARAKGPQDNSALSNPVIIRVNTFAPHI